MFSDITDMVTSYLFFCLKHVGATISWSSLLQRWKVVRKSISGKPRNCDCRWCTFITVSTWEWCKISTQLHTETLKWFNAIIPKFRPGSWEKLHCSFLLSFMSHFCHITVLPDTIRRIYWRHFCVYCNHFLQFFHTHESASGTLTADYCEYSTCALCSWSWIMASSCLLVSNLDLSLWLVASAFSYIYKTCTF